MRRVQKMLSMTLADGRRLAWREYGINTGHPVFFFHGNLNSSHFQPAWEKTETITESCGARIIALDRPGYGDSTFQTDRQYSSAISEIDQLANHLEFQKFSVLGYSSGGPYALACAALLPSRVSSSGLVSADGPYFDMGKELITRMFGTEAVSADYNLARITQEYELLERSYESMSKDDRKAMALADIHHAIKQGLDKGPWQDGMIESREWDFTLEQVESACSSGETGPVLMWHGCADDVVSLDVARHVIDNCPSITSSFFEGESHSMIRRHWGSILTELIAAAHSE